MTLSSQLYCNTCGAANQDQAERCFVCEAPLHAPSREPLLKERYRILVPVGQGGFGAVYKVEDIQGGNRLLAIKEINLSALTAQEVIEATDAFNREVHLLSDLTHPNLPRIYDHFTDREHWYLVMDFIEGETLEQYLDRKLNGCLPLAEVLAIGIQLCTVLNYLHTREPAIIFRDLKPANVMRTSSGHLYLIDFGIARHFKPGQTADTIALGSPGYAAREQYSKAQTQTTPRSDIYSLGATLHQLLTGNDPSLMPFHFAPLHGQPAPAALEMLIMQTVELEAYDRPASMAIVKQELQRIAAQQPLRQASIAQTANQVLRPSTSPPVKASVTPVKYMKASLPAFTLLQMYCGHAREVYAVSWSPDGKLIASGGRDESVQVWDATSGKQVLHYLGHSHWIAKGLVQAVMWSPD